ncbi:hypothetical protein RCL1_005494 [Eukaryota sp. TZLM3-RCL]
MDVTSVDLAILQQQNVGLKTKYHEQREEIRRLKAQLTSCESSLSSNGSILSALRISWETLTQHLACTLTEMGLQDPVSMIQNLPLRPPDEYVDFLTRLVSPHYPESLTAVPTAFQQVLNPTFELISHLSTGIRTLISQRDAACAIPSEIIDRSSALEVEIGLIRARLAAFELEYMSKDEEIARLKGEITSRDKKIVNLNVDLEEMGRRLGASKEEIEKRNVQINNLLEQNKIFSAEVENLRSTESDLRRKIDVLQSYATESGQMMADPEIMSELHDLRTKIRTRTALIDELQKERDLLKEQLASQHHTPTLDDATVRKSTLWRNSYNRMMNAINRSKELQKRFEEFLPSISDWGQTCTAKVAEATSHAEERKTVFKNNLQIAEDTILSLQKQVDELRAHESMKEGSIVASSTEELVKEQQEMIESLRNQLEKATKNVERGEKVVNKDEELEELMTELDDVAGQLAKMIDQNARLLTQLRVKDDANAALLKARHELSFEIQGLKRILETQKKEIVLSRQKCEVADDVINQLKAQLSKEQEVANEAAKALAAAHSSQKSALSSSEKSLTQIMEVNQNVVSLREQISMITKQKNDILEKAAKYEQALTFADEQNGLLRKKLAKAGLGGEAEEGEIELVEDKPKKEEVTDSTVELIEERDLLYEQTKCFCKSQDKQVVLQRCGHCFCRTCINSRLDRRERKCPLCNQVFTKSEVIPIYLAA